MKEKRQHDKEVNNKINAHQVEEKLLILPQIQPYSPPTSKAHSASASHISSVDVSVEQFDPMVISVDEISHLTHWNPTTIMKKARAGIIPFVRLSGKRGIFLRESFVYWLKNQEQNLI